MAVNTQLATKKIMQVVREVREPSMFLADLFFWKTETFNTQKVEIDIFRDDREIAMFTHPDSEPNMRKRKEFTRDSHTPPYIFESLTLRPSDLLFAMLGEHIYSDRSLRQRFVEQISEDAIYLESLVKRRMEWWAAKLLDGGAVTISGKGIPSYTLQFNMPAGNILTLTGAARWDQTTAEPLKDLRVMRRNISQESGLLPNVIIFGDTAQDLFLAHQEVKDYLDSRRGVVVEVNPKHLPRGVVQIGTFEGAALFAYDEQYVEGGVSSRFIPSKRVYFGSTDAQTVRAHGAILNMNALQEALFFIATNTDQRGRVYFLDIESAFIMALSQATAFGYTVVATEP